MDNSVNNPGSKYYVSTERRIELTGVEVTLNGKRAQIVGWSSNFATVTTLPDGRMSAEFAWTTVEHVIEHSKGAFIA